MPSISTVKGPGLRAWICLGLRMGTRLGGFQGSRMQGGVVSGLISLNPTSLKPRILIVTNKSIGDSIATCKG